MFFAGSVMFQSVLCKWAIEASPLVPSFTSIWEAVTSHFHCRSRFRIGSNFLYLKLVYTLQDIMPEDIMPEDIMLEEFARTWTYFWLRTTMWFLFLPTKLFQIIFQWNFVLWWILMLHDAFHGTQINCSPRYSDLGLPSARTGNATDLRGTESATYNELRFKTGKFKYLLLFKFLIKHKWISADM